MCCDNENQRGRHHRSPNANSDQTSVLHQCFNVMPRDFSNHVRRKPEGLQVFTKHEQSNEQGVLSQRRSAPQPGNRDNQDDIQSRDKQTPSEQGGGINLEGMPSQI